MLREQTVAIVSQCQLRYENSTKKIVSSFPHAKTQGRMECLVVQGVRRHSILAIHSIYRRIVWWYCMFERTLPMSSMQLNVDCFHCAIFCTGQKPFSIKKRGLVTFCNSKSWTKQAAARGVASSLCTAAHPLHTRPTNKFGTSVSETTMRPNPRVTFREVTFSV